MYLEFYGLSEKPFTQTPDPRFLYWNDGYRETLASLRYGILERKGFIAMVGEAGTGKTTLLRKLLDDLGDEVVSVFLFNPNATFEEILEYTLSELGISSPAGKKLAMLQQLNEFLLAAFSEGRNTILLIDEAQDLDIDVLESLRLLSNLETAQDKILQIVLSGQPELADRLADPSIRQLKQRIAVRCRLDPLTREELPEFIEARLAVAGGSPSLFLPESLDAIWQYSSGIPRLINTVCDNALLVGYALGRKTIDSEVLREVIADLEKIDPRHTAPILEPTRQDTENNRIIADSATTKPVPTTADISPESRPADPAPEAPKTNSDKPVEPPQRPVNNSLLAGLLAVGLLLFAAVAWFGEAPPAPSVMPSGSPGDVSTTNPPIPARPSAPVLADAPRDAENAAPEKLPIALPLPSPTSDPVPTATPQPTPVPTASPSPTVSPTPTASPAPSASPVPTASALSTAAPVVVAAMPRETASAAIQSGAQMLQPKPVPDAVRLAAVLPPSVGSSPTSPRPAATPVIAPSQPDALPEPAEARPETSTERPITVPALLEIQLGDTLAAMANRVYGTQSYTLLDLIQAANPGLDDPSRIIAGGVVLFPSLDAATRIVSGPDGQLQVIALTTPSLRQALARQSLLQKQLAQPVEIETVSLYDGPDLYRVFLPAFTDPDDALRTAQTLGPVLQK